jgi:cytoskeletal protein RodZ
MNNDNNSELFTAADEIKPAAETAAPQQKGRAEAPVERFSSSAVITEDSIIEENVIPDIDAGGARSCGEFLRLQRERLNLSCEEVFEATKIKPDLIVALENEDFSQLTQPVYVFAYVKRLCQFYNINNALAREFLDRLRAEISFDVPDDVSKTVKGSDVSEENMRRIRNLVVAVSLILLLLLLLIISGVTMVVVHLRKSGNQIEKQSVFSENTLVELQPKPKLTMTEL